MAESLSRGNGRLIPRRERLSRGNAPLISMCESLPRGNETLPPTAEELPRARESLPPTAEELPHGNERLPHGNEELPHGNEEFSDAKTVMRAWRGAARRPCGIPRLKARYAGKHLSGDIVEQSIEHARRDCNQRSLPGYSPNSRGVMDFFG